MLFVSLKNEFELAFICIIIIIQYFNKIYIIKQDIRIYVPYSRPYGWTDWADMGGRGVL